MDFKIQMKLLDCFYQVGGPALTHSYDAASYLIDAGKELYLIDCGTPQGYLQLIENIKACGYSPEKIKAVFGTHGHYDHVGAAAFFKRDYGCKLYLHEGDKECVETGDGMKSSAQLLYGCNFPPCSVDELLTDGQVFEPGSIAMEVIQTPGHTPGGVCFSLKIGTMTVLVAGDTLYGGFSKFVNSNEADWKNSLERLTNRHFDAYVFGHCPPQLLCDADRRIADMTRSFANYYNPWFKTFYEKYSY